jgi:hypothetical protein
MNHKNYFKIFITVVLLGSTVLLYFFLAGWRPNFNFNGGVKINEIKVRQTGMISAKSQPEGANVYLDGVLNTATNNSLSGIEPGKHKLKITIHKTVNKKGYLEKSFANKPAFIEALNTYLTAFDAKRKKKPIRMLLDSDGSAMSPDNLRYRLHKIIGKPISSQMLRKITSSARGPPKKELIEMAERAAAMGHDLQTHINYYVKS